MLEITRTRRIAAPASDLWSRLADFGAIARWAANVDHSCLLTHEDDAGVGAVRRVQVGRTTLLECVVRWEPEVALAYRLEGLPPIVRSVVNEWHLESAGDATLVTLRTEIEPGPRPPEKAVAKLLGRRLAKASDVMLDGLAAQAHTREAA